MKVKGFSSPSLEQSGRLKPLQMFSKTLRVFFQKFTFFFFVFVVRHRLAPFFSWQTASIFYL